VSRAEVAFDEEPLVLGIEDGPLVLLAGEGFDGGKRVPEGEHHELGPLTDIAAEHPDAPVTGGLRVAGHTGFLHVLRIGVAVLFANSALPNSSDHPSSLVD
jgi:hypothetical protein